MPPEIIVYRETGERPDERMQFRLYHEGKLLSTRGRVESGQTDSRATHKHAVRKGFHRQLKRLWSLHPTLNRWSQGTTTINLEGSATADLRLSRLANTFTSNNFKWAPLVNEPWKLTCSIEILYMRQGVPFVLAQSDLDNRVKTIVDALKMPAVGELPASAAPEDDETPFFVLLQDDTMISRLSVEADTLLAPTDTALGDTDSRVVITVTVWPYQPTLETLALG